MHSKIGTAIYGPVTILTSLYLYVSILPAYTRILVLSRTVTRFVSSHRTGDVTYFVLISLKILVSVG